MQVTANEREEINAINRKGYRELKYEMDPYEWRLAKLPNGKTRTVIVDECEKYQDWEINNVIPGTKVPQQIINLKQTIIDSFEVKNGFP